MREPRCKSRPKNLAMAYSLLLHLFADAICPLVAMSIISQVARLFVQISRGEVRSVGQRLARARFCSGEAVTSSRQEKQDASILHAIR